MNKERNCISSSICLDTARQQWLLHSFNSSCSWRPRKCWANCTCLESAVSNYMRIDYIIHEYFVITQPIHVYYICSASLIEEFFILGLLSYCFLCCFSLSFQQLRFCILKTNNLVQNLYMEESFYCCFFISSQRYPVPP